MRAEIMRYQTAEDAAIGEVEAQLTGLAVKYREEERHRSEMIDSVRYQNRSALRWLEDRDTTMPAGSDGVEETGYQHGNVGVVAGRSVRTRIVLLVVLALAMVADLITFRQVIERVVNDSMVLPMVAALTATTTYIAHKAGELFKAAKETNRTIRRAVGGWSLSAVWTAMGIGAFVFRLLAPPPISADAVDIFVNAGTPAGSATDGSPALSALLLLFLYVLTGAIAISAGYQRPREEIGQYRKTRRVLRRSEPRLAATRRYAAEADALGKQLTDLRVGRWGLYAVEIERCEAAARRLKAEARMVIRRLLRSGELPWYRRMLGDRATLSDDVPVTEPTNEPINEPSTGTAAESDRAGRPRDTAGGGQGAPEVF
jgi:hypothetical protein